MTNEQIIEDLKTIMDDYRTRTGGVYPAALAEAVRIIEELHDGDGSGQKEEVLDV